MEDCCHCGCHEKGAVSCSFCRESHPEKKESLDDVAKRLVREAKEAVGPGCVVVVMVGDFIANQSRVEWGGPDFAALGLKDIAGKVMDERIFDDS